jgi:hypothetical protein
MKIIDAETKDKIYQYATEQLLTSAENAIALADAGYAVNNTCKMSMLLLARTYFEVATTFRTSISQSVITAFNNILNYESQ